MRLLAALWFPISLVALFCAALIRARNQKSKLRRQMRLANDDTEPSTGSP